jgi:hypothetical protein
MKAREYLNYVSKKVVKDEEIDEKERKIDEKKRRESDNQR